MRDAARIRADVAAAGRLRRGEPVLVMLSGGRDSVCLLDLAVALCGPGAVRAVHVDHGLRASARAEAGLCRALCAALHVPLEVEILAGPPRGNVQAWARAERYAAARRHRGDARIAVAHTADDRLETLLYRLAASPGRRALLGMAASEGDVIRPLLGVTRAETGAYCAERGLAWAEDPTNDDPAYARNRARRDLLPAFRSLHPAADANALATQDLLRAEAEVLDSVVAGALHAAGSPPEVARLATLGPALARLAVQALADAAADGAAPAIGARVPEILALGTRGGTASLDLPGGLVAEVSYGRLRIARRVAPAAPPAPGVLPVPGELAFGDGRVRAHTGSFARGDGVLSDRALDGQLEVRPWRDGDSMRPAGRGGSRSLQDLFTDARVPRPLRRRLPVVLAGGEVAWVPGVATGERVAARPGEAGRVRLSWDAPQYDGPPWPRTP